MGLDTKMKLPLIKCQTLGHAFCVGLSVFLEDASCGHGLQAAVTELAKSADLQPAMTQYKSHVKQFMDSLHC